MGDFTRAILNTWQLGESFRIRRTASMPFSVGRPMSRSCSALAGQLVVRRRRSALSACLLAKLTGFATNSHSLNYRARENYVVGVVLGGR
jgi:hypothetical protein